jgi:hypothetical protein
MEKFPQSALRKFTRSSGAAWFQYFEFHFSFHAVQAHFKNVKKNKSCL